MDTSVTGTNENFLRITQLRCKGIHDVFDYDIKFNEKLTVFFGDNGSGKTTILHILANIIGGDIVRFFSLKFTEIHLDTNRGTVSINRPDEKRILVQILGTKFDLFREDSQTILLANEYIWSCFGDSIFYLPAFRNVAEAAQNNNVRIEPDIVGPQGRITSEIYKLEAKRVDKFRGEEERSYRQGIESSPEIRRTISKTSLCRKLFGSFVPIIRMPSLVEMQEMINDEIRVVQMRLNIVDRQSVNTFAQSIIELLLKDEKNHENYDFDLKEIENRLSSKVSTMFSLNRDFSRIYKQIRRHVKSADSVEENEATQSVFDVLRAYEEVIDHRIKIQNSDTSKLRSLEDGVNGFLNKKTLSISNIDPGPRLNRLMIEVGDRKFPFEVLSSGERQILTMLFCISPINQSYQNLLIDEPELSMHVTWQRRLMPTIMEQTGNRQLIICTHSPEIVADYRQYMVKIEAKINNMNDRKRD